MDQYSRLKETPFHSENVYCICDVPVLVLGMMVSYLPNPIRCMNCLELVNPSEIPVPISEVFVLSDWALSLASINWLAFNESSYENWADSERTNFHSKLNEVGLGIHGKLNESSKIYYWYSRNMNDVTENCPICKKKMTKTKYKYSSALQCEDCLIAAAPYAG